MSETYTAKDMAKQWQAGYEAGDSALREAFESGRHCGPRSLDGYCLASDQEAWDNFQAGWRAALERREKE